MSVYKATSPYMTGDQCAAYVQDRGQLYMVLKLTESDFFGGVGLDKRGGSQFPKIKKNLKCCVAQLSYEPVRDKSHCS